MNRKEVRNRTRAEALKEAKLDNEREVEVEQKLGRWKRATAIIGVALLVSTVGVVPFLSGQALHNWWDVVGKRLLLVAMGLFGVFIYIAGHTAIFWYDLRGLRRINKKYAPPGSKYRTGKKG